MELRSHIQKDLQDLENLRGQISEAFRVTIDSAQKSVSCSQADAKDEMGNLEMAKKFAALLQSVDCITAAANHFKEQVNEDPLRFVDTPKEEVDDLVNSYIEKVMPNCVPKAELASIQRLQQQLFEEKRETVTPMDEDIVVTKQVETYKDPITQSPLVDPVKSLVCNHYYEKLVISQCLEVFARYQCPVAGCTNTLDRSQIVEDPELKAKLEKKNPEA